MLSDDRAEYQLRGRLSFMGFYGLAVRDPVPGTKMIWLFREQLVRVGAFERLFARFDAAVAERGYLAKGGEIAPPSRPADHGRCRRRRTW